MVRRVVLLGVATALAVSGVAAGEGTASATRPIAGRAGSPGSSGGGDPYFPGYGNGGYDVASYAINDTFDLGSPRLTTGTTTITARATQDLSAFNLDVALVIDSVKVNGVTAGFNKSAQELTVTPATSIANGATFTTVVTYHSNGTPNGWFYGGGEILCTGEPEEAQYWYPSDNITRDPATYDVTLNVPSGKQGVTTGELVSRTTTGGRTISHWVTHEPMASYANFFAVGAFDEASETVNGVRYRYFVSQNLTSAQRTTNMKLLKLTPSLVAEEASDYGPYPYADGGGLVSSTFSNEDYAMENQTRPTYPLMADDDDARRLIAHELGHQWFGDDVRPFRWRDIVDNEGFARWTEFRWNERHGGPTAQAQLESTYAAHPANDSFWQLVIDDPGANHIFDLPVYDRGGMMVQALRHRVGDTTFFAILHQWIASRGGTAATVADFEALASSVSGQDLSGFFQAWLRTQARPAHTAANGF